MANEVATTWGGKITLGRAPASNEILLGDANGNFELTAASSISPSIQTLLDGISNTQGSILYRSASAWSALAPGTAGHVLSTNGAGANPSWVAQSSYTPTWTDIVKTSDQIITSSTTLTNATGLSFSVSANTYYSFEFNLIFNIPTGGLDVSITCPTGGTLVFGISGGLYAATTGSGTRYVVVSNAAFNNPITVTVLGYLSNGANAGTLQFQYSQNASTAVNLTMRKGSWGQYRTV